MIRLLLSGILSIIVRVHSHAIVSTFTRSVNEQSLPESMTLADGAADHLLRHRHAHSLQHSGAAIDELEPVQRSVYCGAIGYIGFDGSMQTSVPIRILLVKGKKVYFQVGGGIVADSDPEAEYEETMHKARGSLEALGLPAKGLAPPHSPSSAPC